jgi:uncharacterized protein YwqG
MKNIFRHLWPGRKNPEAKPPISFDEFIRMKSIQGLLHKYQRPTVLLRPHKAALAISPDKSKFGGIPNGIGFDEYPCCDSCHTPLNFVLQLYKEDFPDLYFPQGKNLFQLFRCPKFDYPSDEDIYKYDHRMFVYYFDAGQTRKLKTLDKPKVFITEDHEDEVPDCYLKPKRINDDFPNYDDFEEGEFNLDDVSKAYGEQIADQFMEVLCAMDGTKIGGHPGFIQSPYHPVCNCGKQKEFFFQLSSNDMEDGVSFPPNGAWSAHGIMIGDVGNICWFVCKDCGEGSIESYWDCS